METFPLQKKTSALNAKRRCTPMTSMTPHSSTFLLEKTSVPSAFIGAVSNVSAAASR